MFIRSFLTCGPYPDVMRVLKCPMTILLLRFFVMAHQMVGHLTQNVAPRPPLKMCDHITKFKREPMLVPHATRIT